MLTYMGKYACSFSSEMICSGMYEQIISDRICHASFHAIPYIKLFYVFPKK